MKIPKSLIIYASLTGNTEKLALRFKKIFEKNNWECDIFRVTRDTQYSQLPQFFNYDFLCLGSPVILRKPLEDLEMIFPLYGKLPNEEFEPLPKGTIPLGPPPESSLKTGPMPKLEKITFDGRKGVVFATYSGIYLGPKEVEPVLSYLSVQMECALRFQCIGQISCVARHAHHDEGWYKDLANRPTERDLLKAEIIMEEIIENNYING